MVFRFTLAALALGASVAGTAWGQDNPQPAQPDGPNAPLRADHPLAQPVLYNDVLVLASRTTAFSDGDAQVLLLEGDVHITIGAHGFDARNAVIRIDSGEGYGPDVRHLAIYFDHAEPTGQSAVRMESPRLLVTAAVRGKFELETPSLSQADQPPQHALVAEAHDRVVQYHMHLRQPLGDVPDSSALTQEQQRLRDTRRAAIEAERERIELPQPGDLPRVDTELVERPVLPTHGTVRYAWGFGVYQMGEDQDVVMLSGGVTIMYQDTDEDRDVRLTAERVVLFIDHDSDSDGSVPSSLDASKIRGIYLEDNVVITDDNVTVRAPRVYYDPQANRATLLDAVIYAIDLERQVPLYLRAEVIRQSSADTFEAHRAVMTTSEFAQPHLALGAERITMVQETQDDGFVERWVTAEDMTLQMSGASVFYWPWISAPAHATPLKRINVGFRSRSGVEVQTAWDLYALAGQRAPEGVELLGNLDYRGDHGVGLGVELDYETPQMNGELQGYFLASDSGDDDIADRNDIAFDNDQRGFFHAQHRQNLPSGWELSLEGAYVSDPTFLEEFFRSEAYQARPYETSLYLKNAQDDWALTALIRGEVNNFTPQLPQLLTPGYTVDKLPELFYTHAASVFGDRATWYHESRLSRVRARFGDDSPADRGFTPAQSMAVFGISATTSFDAAARAAGFPRDSRTRFDTRNELAAPMRIGAVDVTPFVVGRLTAYDDDFAGFNGGNDDQVRLWYGGGVTLSTEFSRTYGGVSSDLFDLNGIRHIVEPGVTLAWYGSSHEDGDLPVYDPEVEDLAEGAVIRIGAVNTLQTRRGGPGRERTVDWLKVRTDFIVRSNDADVATEIPRFFDHRPEYALGGDHFYAEMLWAATEALAVTGELTHSFEQGHVVQWRLGTEMRHDKHLSSFANYREIDSLDARLLSYGLSMQLSTKYRLTVFHVLDFGQNNSRSLNIALDRKIPRASLQLLLSYDEVDNQTSINLVLIPDGFGNGLGSGLLGR